LGPVITWMTVAATFSYDLGLYIVAGLQFLSGPVLLLFRKRGGPEKIVMSGCGEPTAAHTSNGGGRQR
jgi:hypothetical protein